MSALDFLSAAARDELEQLIDERVAQRLAQNVAGATPVSPYMTIPEAAEYLRCSRQRIDDLLSQRRLTRHKDGSRTLISRADIERYVDRC